MSTAKNFIDNCKKVVKNVSGYIQENNLESAQHELTQLVQNIQTDFTRLVEKDLGLLKTRFQGKKKEIESLLNKTIVVEVKNAQEFIDQQKLELSKMQKKLEAFIKAEKKKAKSQLKKKLKKTGVSSSSGSGAATKKKVVRKKTSKKASSTKTTSAKA
jgi:hypothetical protein